MKLLCTVLWAAAREVFVKAKSGGALSLLNIFEWLNLYSLQGPCLPVSLLSLPVLVHPFWWITCCCPNLPCISQFCAFPWAMFCAWSTVSHSVLFHGLFSVLEARLPPLHLATSPPAFKVHLSHLLIYEVFPEFLFQVKLSALFFFTPIVL